MRLDGLTSDYQSGFAAFHAERLCLSGSGRSCTFPRLSLGKKSK
jgi:hypothetical protein